MENENLISIITPTYNHEDYIKQCIDSVLSQTYPYWEQIIIDDGSTDKTADIIREYDDERIIYIKQENQGIYQLKNTYNRALKLSKGEYIAILEGDDYWPDYKLERQIKSLENQEIVLSWGNAQIVDEKGNDKKIVHKPDSYPQITKNNEILDELLLTNYIPACTVLCRKKTLLKVGGFQQPQKAPFADYATWLELSKKGGFQYENNLMGYWRHHQRQVSSKHALEMLKTSFDTSLEFYDQLTTEEKEQLNINHHIILKQKEKMLNDLSFGLGRECLKSKRWQRSRNYFKTALKGSLKIKFYAMIGILFSYLKKEM
ncbi:MAG: glycosyltransferase [Methanobacterium sp.]|nr:glycosyltransferase [Methanobacterium sp.]